MFVTSVRVSVPGAGSWSYRLECNYSGCNSLAGWFLVRRRSPEQFDAGLVCDEQLGPLIDHGSVRFGYPGQHGIGTDRLDDQRELFHQYVPRRELSGTSLAAMFFNPARQLGDLFERAECLHTPGRK